MHAFMAAVLLGMAGLDSFNANPDRKSTRLNSSHSQISYAVFCLKKKKQRHANALVSLSHQRHLSDSAFSHRPFRHSHAAPPPLRSSSCATRHLAVTVTSIQHQH